LQAGNSSSKDEIENLLRIMTQKQVNQALAADTPATKEGRW